MSDVPELKDEIERKAIETIEKIVSDLANGRISEAQYAYGLDILWSAVAGLAGKDFFAIIEAAKLPKKNKSFFTREFYRTPNEEILAMLTNLHDGRIHLSVGGKSKVYDFRDEPNPFAAAKAKFQSLGDNLIARDFNQL